MKKAVTVLLIMISGLGQVAWAEEGANGGAKTLRRYLMELPANPLKVARLDEKFRTQLEAINEQLEQLIAEQLILSIQ